MACETCYHLLAAYTHFVTLFSDAVRKGSGAIGDDAWLTIEEAARLSQECMNANHALMAHWREHHKSLGKSAGASAQGKEVVPSPLPFAVSAGTPIAGLLGAEDIGAGASGAPRPSPRT